MNRRDFLQFSAVLGFLANTPTLAFSFEHSEDIFDGFMLARLDKQDDYLRLVFSSPKGLITKTLSLTKDKRELAWLVYKQTREAYRDYLFAEYNDTWRRYEKEGLNSFLLETLERLEELVPKGGIHA